jgi:putative N6-adenine-specific DNA methylase
MSEKMVATTFQGLEQVLATELEQLGAGGIEIRKRAVAFEGDKVLLYAANMHLFTAVRILLPVASFQADSPDELYDRARDIPWENWLEIQTTFAITFAIHSEYFTHTQYAALRLKDAIVDRFRSNGGERPSVDTNNPDIPLHLHINQDQVTVSLNSSGHSLHKRGYRQTVHKVPLSEVLAAGMIRLSGWDMQVPLYDPMCGSATLPIEAALAAYRIAPGLIRNDFAFKHWKDYDPGIFKQLLLQAQSDVLLDRKLIITGSDMQSRVLAQAAENVKAAKLEDRISLFPKRFEDADPPKFPGIAIINPPYGERMKKDDMIAFYRAMGDRMKQAYKGWKVWVLTSNLEAAKFIGLKPSRKIVLFNGPLECRFLCFDIYEGSKKYQNEN